MRRGTRWALQEAARREQALPPAVAPRAWAATAVRSRRPRSRVASILEAWSRRTSRRRIGRHHLEGRSRPVRSTRRYRWPTVEDPCSCALEPPPASPLPPKEAPRESPVASEMRLSLVQALVLVRVLASTAPSTPPAGAPPLNHACNSATVGRRRGSRLRHRDTMPRNETGSAGGSSTSPATSRPEGRTRVSASHNVRPSARTSEAGGGRRIGITDRAHRIARELQMVSHHQHVRRLQATLNEVLSVQVFERGERRHQHLARLVFRERAPFQHLRQGLVRKLHPREQVVRSIDAALADLEDPDQVRMRELDRRLPARELRVGGGRLHGDEFQRRGRRCMRRGLREEHTAVVGASNAALQGNAPLISCASSFAQTALMQCVLPQSEIGSAQAPRLLKTPEVAARTLQRVDQLLEPRGSGLLHRRIHGLRATRRPGRSARRTPRPGNWPPASPARRAHGPPPAAAGSARRAHAPSPRARGPRGRQESQGPVGGSGCPSP